MNHRDKLTEIHQKILSGSDFTDNLLSLKEEIDLAILSKVDLIGNNCSKHKSVYVVLVTLLVHKSLHPDQDVRYHQDNLRNGFSGRTIDTRFISPTLRELGLPSASESGWLTRSLEQPSPYTLTYPGKISGSGIKEAFLAILDFLEDKTEKQKQQKVAELLLILLMQSVIKVIRTQDEEIKKNKISLRSTRENSIDYIFSALKTHFFYENYQTKGTSKLPVIAIYSLYTILLSEMQRYDQCVLKPLGSHTASNRTSKTAGDIEIVNRDSPVNLLEVIEVKHLKPITFDMVAVVKDKIEHYRPERYLILSTSDIENKDITKINSLILEIEKNYQCQLIINGVLPTIKYYLRLIRSQNKFLDIYSKLIMDDQEIDFVHKKKWREILNQ